MHKVDEVRLMAEHSDSAQRQMLREHAALLKAMEEAEHKYGFANNLAWLRQRAEEILRRK